MQVESATERDSGSRLRREVLRQKALQERQGRGGRHHKDLAREAGERDVQRALVCSTAKGKAIDQGQEKLQHGV